MYEFPVFSPDSSISSSGVVRPEHDAVRGWRTGARVRQYRRDQPERRALPRPHTVRVLAVKGGSVYRVLVDLK
jgi:hypothetical protein